MRNAGLTEMAEISGPGLNWTSCKKGLMRAGVAGVFVAVSLVVSVTDVEDCSGTIFADVKGSAVASLCSLIQTSNLSCDWQHSSFR